MRNTARSVEPQRSLPRRLGRYILVEHLARGGMADVHLGQRDDGRLVVVKEVIGGLTADEIEAARYDDLLICESKLVGGLRHANIARALGWGRDGAGAPYAAFEYVEGVDLRDLLRTCSRRKIALPVATSLFVIREVLRALKHAHRRRDGDRQRLRVVHRDVTPSNVLLSFDGHVKLCDFGIALARCMPAVPDDRIEGKTGYMSPEQARGAKLDRRSDIYAVGIMLWELLAGRRMRPKKGAPALASARRGEVPPIAVRGFDREEEILAITRRALARRRKDRYRFAGDMLRDLDAYCADTGVDISPADLGAWLSKVLAPERELAERRRCRVKAAVLDLAEDPSVVETPPASGVRPVKRPAQRKRKRRRKALTPTPTVKPPAFARNACAISAMTFALLCMLAWAGVI